MIGLGTMGRNLVLNMADKGFAVAAFNRTASVTDEFVSGLQPGQRVRPCYSLEELLAAVEPPRRVMMMVDAGKAVDAVLAGLDPLLQAGDIVIDGGNSHFKDTERRSAALGARGIDYLGVGISGGESGARHGPSMMPGGARDAYDAVRAIFEAVAAKADGAPCVAYLGPGSAGHYVKMVHNGIEYGLMQLIAESYALLKQGLGLDNERLAAVYADWQAGELESYLLEITAAIFRRRDDKTPGFLVDLILGEAGQLGTGMWTSQSAMDLHVPVPNIDIAVSMRNLSALDDERAAARQLLGQAGAGGRPGGRARRGGGRPLRRHGARCPLCRHDHHLRAGLRAAPARVHHSGLRPGAARCRLDLARGLHHPLGSAPGYPGGLRAAARICRICCSILNSAGRWCPGAPPSRRRLGQGWLRGYPSRAFSRPWPTWTAISPSGYRRI